MNLESTNPPEDTLEARPTSIPPVAFTNLMGLDIAPYIKHHLLPAHCIAGLIKGLPRPLPGMDPCLIVFSTWPSASLFRVMLAVSRNALGPIHTWRWVIQSAHRMDPSGYLADPWTVAWRAQSQTP